MNALTGSPNRFTRPLRRTAAVVLVGSVGLTGCNSPNTETDTTSTSTNSSGNARTELVVDDNCVVKTGGEQGLMSNTAKPVETFVMEYVAALDEASPADLSQCVDETLDAVLHTPSNTNIGAGSPAAEVHTVYVPTDITPR